jgi:hypothetical protein
MQPRDILMPCPHFNFKCECKIEYYVTLVYDSAMNTTRTMLHVDFNIFSHTAPLEVYNKYRRWAGNEDTRVARGSAPTHSRYTAGGEVSAASHGSMSPAITFWLARWFDEVDQHQHENGDNIVRDAVRNEDTDTWDIINTLELMAKNDQYLLFICIDGPLPHLIIVDTDHWRRHMDEDDGDEDIPQHLKTAVEEYNDMNNKEKKYIIFILLVWLSLPLLFLSSVDSFIAYAIVTTYSIFIALWVRAFNIKITKTLPSRLTSAT